jgi:hypothetical protein
VDVGGLVVLGIELADDVLYEGGFAGSGYAGNRKAFTAVEQR